MRTKMRGCSNDPKTGSDLHLWFTSVHLTSGQFPLVCGCFVGAVYACACIGPGSYNGALGPATASAGQDRRTEVSAQQPITQVDDPTFSRDHTDPLELTLLAAEIVEQP